MSKAKPIDRLELTRKKFGAKMKQQEHDYGLDDIPPDIDIHGLKECPVCGSKSLRLDGGCMSCLSCGWSACG